jgi:hypothetical protein
VWRSILIAHPISNRNAVLRSEHISLTRMHLALTLSAAGAGDA